MTDKFTTFSFVDYFVEQKRHVNTFLDKIDRLIDWNPVERLLKSRSTKNGSVNLSVQTPKLPLNKEPQ